MNTSTPAGGPSRRGWLVRLFRGHSGQSETQGFTFPVLSAEATPRWPTRKQIKYLPHTLNAVELWIVRVTLLLLCASAIFVVVRFVERHLIALPKAGGSYTEAILGSPQYINPVLAYSNDVDRDLTKLLFRGLFQINGKGEIVPDLASHVEVSSDGKTYVITLRQGMVWHDGVPITSSDVAFTFTALTDPEYQSPLQSTYKDLKVEIVDDKTIKMTLANPYAPFLSTLTIGILPEHIWGDIPGANFGLAEYNVKPIGSGPYAFASLTKDRRGTIKAYHLVRFDQYYGPHPYINDLTFRFYASPAETLDAVKHNQADGIGFVTSEMRPELKKEGVQLKELRLPQYTAVFYNERTTLLKDKTIRQSLERATDSKAIISQALGGAGEAIHAPILPGSLGYDAGVRGLAYDPNAAAKALDDAGWKLQPGDTVRKKDGKELRLSLSTVDRPEYTKTAELLREFWAKIGVGLEIRLFSSNDIIKKVIKPRDYEALLFGEIVGLDPDPYPFWHSSQSYDPGLNLAVFYNKNVDQLLEEARQTNDLEQRRLKYLQFQAILAEEEPAIFLYNPFYTYGIPKKIKGFSTERITAPADRFSAIEHWYIKTRPGWK